MVIPAFAAEFRRYRSLAERATAQITFDQLRQPLDPQTNSIAVIMKHVAGNLRSRWTDPFTSDGEKPWRNRDNEFTDTFATREDLMNAWNAGWTTLESALATCTDADLARTLTIRGEPHTLALALARSLSHTAYHTGQIVQVARVMASRSGVQWRTLTVPRGKSEEFNQSMGFDAKKNAAKSQRSHMDQEQWPEWFSLRDEATRRLKAADWQLRLSVLPSFDNAHSLGIVIQGKQTRVLHQVWRYNLDVEKFRTPIDRMRHPTTLQPTIEEHSEPIGTDVLQHLLESLNQSLPQALPPARSLGLDGTTYEVAAGTYMHNLSVQWWGRGPSEWQGLVEYFQATWRTLVSATPDDPLPKLDTFA